MSDFPQHPGLEAPRSGTMFQEMCEQGREHNNRMYDAYISWAAMLERRLRRATGNPWLLGIDVKIAARRTVRPLMKAAEEYRHIAQGWMRVKYLFEENFQNTSSGRHAGGDRIDVNK